jgi:ribosome modulation factor
MSEFQDQEGTTAVLDNQEPVADLAPGEAIDEAGTGTVTIVATGPAIEESAPLDPREAELAALRGQLAASEAQNKELGSKLDQKSRHERDVMLLESMVAEKESVVNDLKDDLKEAKEQFDIAVANLRAAIRRRDGQGELPFPEDGATEESCEASSETAPVVESAPQKVDDPHGATPLTQIGISESQCEKLATVDPAIETVAQLEAFIASGKFLPKSIKGLGESAVNSIHDKLMAFRQTHPNPNEKPPAPVNGEWDTTQYHAGQIGYALGKKLSENPHTKKSHAKDSWAAGWRAKQTESGGKQPEEPLVKAYRLGCEAALENASRESNPYADGNENIAWFNGWDATNDHQPETTGSATFVQAIEQCRELISLANDVDNPEAANFVESVTAQVREMHDWIEENQKVTDEQLTALANWKSGVEAWIR